MIEASVVVFNNVNTTFQSDRLTPCYAYSPVMEWWLFVSPIAVVDSFVCPL